MSSTELTGKRGLNNLNDGVESVAGRRGRTIEKIASFLWSVAPVLILVLAAIGTPPVAARNAANPSLLAVICDDPDDGKRLKAESSAAVLLEPTSRIESLSSVTELPLFAQPAACCQPDLRRPRAPPRV